MLRKRADRRPRSRPAAPAYQSPSRPETTDNTGRLRPGQPGPRNSGAWLGRLGRRLGLLLLTVAIVVSLVNVLSVSPRARIEPLDATGPNTTFLSDRAEYQAVADDLLASSIWNRNKITINTASISDQLVSRFPELSSASVTLPLLAHRPVIYVQPARASLVVAADNGAYVIDQNGRALAPGASLPAARNLPQIVDKSGLEITVGRQVLPSDDVTFIQTVLAELRAKHIRVSSMVLPVASRELDVYIDGQRYFVKFNLANNNARQQAGTYLATVAELRRQHATPRQYIDVRVEGRAYYK